MDKILVFFAQFNVQTIIAMIIISWYFVRDIKNEMKILEAKMDRQSDRTDRLYEMFLQVNTRISRVEGTVYGKEIYEKLKD